MRSSISFSNQKSNANRTIPGSFVKNAPNLKNLESMDREQLRLNEYDKENMRPMEFDSNSAENWSPRKTVINLW